VRNPEAVLADPGLVKVIDLDDPVMVLLTSTLSCALANLRYRAEVLLPGSAGDAQGRGILRILGDEEGRELPANRRVAL
jgi:hypothetical protein